jgi:hypothetical protein
LADIYLTLAELEQLFANLTITMLNIDFDPTAESTSENSPVRISWPTDGAPAWQITDDVNFVRVIPVDNDYDKIRDVSYSYLSDSSLNKATSRTRVFQVIWTVYGPNSFTNAETIRDSLFDDIAHDTLAQNNIYMITDVPEITRAPEQFANQWWERCDLSVMFNGLIVKNTTVSSVASIPIVVSTPTTTDNENIVLD